MLAENQLIARLATKIVDLDDQVTKLTGIRINLLNELSEIRDRLSTVEQKQILIEKKLEQSKIPSLLDEFMVERKKSRTIKHSTPKPRRKRSYTRKK